MNLFLVYPHARRGWNLVREGEPLPMHFRERDVAIGYAQCLASANRPSVLRVEVPFGAVDCGWIYEGSRPGRPLSVPRR